MRGRPSVKCFKCGMPYCICEPAAEKPLAPLVSAEGELKLNLAPMNPKGVRESSVEADHMKTVKEDGGESLKFTSPARRSVPDRIDLYGVERMMLVLAQQLNAWGAGVPKPETLREMCVRLLAAGIEFTECKKPGEVPTEAQHREHQRLRARGFTVNVIDQRRPRKPRARKTKQ